MKFHSTSSGTHQELAVVDAGAFRLLTALMYAGYMRIVRRAWTRAGAEGLTRSSSVKPGPRTSSQYGMARNQSERCKSLVQITLLRRCFRTVWECALGNPKAIWHEPGMQTQSPARKHGYLLHWQNRKSRVPIERVRHRHGDLCGQWPVSSVFTVYLCMLIRIIRASDMLPAK